MKQQVEIRKDHHFNTKSILWKVEGYLIKTRPSFQFMKGSYLHNIDKKNCQLLGAHVRLDIYSPHWRDPQPVEIHNELQSETITGTLLWRNGLELGEIKNILYWSDHRIGINQYHV